MFKNDYLPLWEGLPVSERGKKRRKSGSKKTTPTPSNDNQLVTAMNFVVDILEMVLRPLPINMINNGRHADGLVGVVNDLINDVSIPLMKSASVKVHVRYSILYQLIVPVVSVAYTPTISFVPVCNCCQGILYHACSIPGLSV